jgi:hypothetical protein
MDIEDEFCIECGTPINWNPSEDNEGHIPNNDYPLDDYGEDDIEEDEDDLEEEDEKSVLDDDKDDYLVEEDLEEDEE